jgi:glycosyltransferase involved in cell wall biosynthesis
MLAIVIPYYKLTFFRKTLESLAAQTDQRFNVYIGNDASPEDPRELLKEFEGKFNFKYKKFDKNLGSISLTKQWERCVAMIRQEEWFMILGDDDYFSSNVIEEFYKNIETAAEKDISVIKLNSTIVDENNNIQLEKKPEPFIKKAVAHFFDKFGNEGRSSLSEHIFRKSQYEKFGFYDFPFAWHSDDLALLEFSDYGDILFLEKSKCFVRISAESITGDKVKYKLQKQKASQMFFDRICLNLNKFSQTEKRKLFDIIQWHEKDKNFKIKIPNKIFEYIKCYGFIKALKILL